MRINQSTRKGFANYEMGSFRRKVFVVSEAAGRREVMELRVVIAIRREGLVQKREEFVGMARV